MITHFHSHLFRFSLLSLVLWTLVSCEKSCDTKCFDDKFPMCGAWVHSDNNQHAAGVYLLDEGYANFTCVISSVPRPTTIKWFFEPEFAKAFVDRVPVTCSSLRTSTVCKHNDFGEHKVTSECLLRIDHLEQSGSYYCSGQLEKYQDAESSKMKVHVYGIANITMYDESDFSNALEFGKIGRIRARVCANPKPHLVWIHRRTGRTVPAGESTENETASVLYHELEASKALGRPVLQNHYCYVAALIMGRVRSDSHAWTVLAWNSVDSKRLDVPVRVIGEPPPPKSGFRATGNWMYIALLSALVTLGTVG